ncbi:hypothetical protein [Spirulina sp. 06S082]|uniref:hypothetical protein n=1 Tax=Spirulina sp. 06S082 TaxID=3110248 RepID=UPI002B1EFD03|nr:hypothetical protein [Spirulina sp. 06S082]MEA5472237.1 hypothetical protein [Spirulina sp. 06S082]
MNIGKVFAETSLFISEAFARIFSPTDDMYPLVGVQPFSGDPYEKKRHFDW